MICACVRARACVCTFLKDIRFDRVLENKEEMEG
jgi:hypothetical protein